MQVYNTMCRTSSCPSSPIPKKVMLALRWVINEMEKRYRILAKVGVRNIAGFNSRAAQPSRCARAESPQLEFLEVNTERRGGRRGSR